MLKYVERQTQAIVVSGYWSGQENVVATERADRLYDGTARDALDSLNHGLDVKGQARTALVAQSSLKPSAT